MGRRNQPPNCVPVLPHGNWMMPKSAYTSRSAATPPPSVEPGVLLAGGEPERDAGVEGERRILAEVVVARGVAGLDRALLDRVHHLEPGTSSPAG
jgi:hypothetical protein